MSVTMRFTSLSSGISASDSWTKGRVLTQPRISEHHGNFPRPSVLVQNRTGRFSSTEVSSHTAYESLRNRQLVAAEIQAASEGRVLAAVPRRKRTPENREHSLLRMLR